MKRQKDEKYRKYQSSLNAQTDIDKFAIKDPVPPVPPVKQEFNRTQYEDNAMKRKRSRFTKGICILVLGALCTIFPILWLIVEPSNGLYWVVLVIISICALYGAYLSYKARDHYKWTITEGIAEYEKKIQEKYERAIVEYETALVEYEMALAEYDIALAEYEKQRDHRQASYNTSISALQTEFNVFESQEQAAANQIAKTQPVLDKLYAINLIYPKYRNFAAMATICEYFMSGRCTELEGADGAYNLYESELRQNVIIIKLDTIINKLDQIQKTQFMLYTAMKEANTLLERISADVSTISTDVSTIKESSAATAYYSQITAKNTTVLKDIAYYNVLTRK
jgi:hypothetical protein